MRTNYLSEHAICVIALLRGIPISVEMKSHLLKLFGEGGLVDEIEKAQEKRRAQCPCAGTRNCDCGACTPYRQGPLLDEVLAEIHAFERKEFVFNNEGVALRLPKGNLPF